MARPLPVALPSTIAPAAPAPPQTAKVPQFLQKLYNIVDDPATNDVICWSDTGNSFFVLDHERMAKELLGNWFKHTNFPSFVRQLNMYGFKKVPDLQQGVIHSDGRTEHHQFAHEHFLRGQRQLLPLIDRKKGNHTKNQPQAAIAFDMPPALPAAPSLGQLDMHTIVSGIAAIRRHQTAISSELNELKQSNQALWQESMEARARHQKQQDTINRIVKFLAGVFGNAAAGSKDDLNGLSPSHSPMQLSTGRLMIEGAQQPPKTRVGIVEVEDEDANRPPSREVSPSSTRFVAVETPASTAEPASPAATDRSAFPPTPSAESATSPVDTTPLAANNQQQILPDTLRPVSPGRLSPLLNGFTPADLSQFLSSLMLPLPNDLSTLADPNQAITAYQPFDFGSYSPPPLALPSPKPLSPSPPPQELLGFPADLQSQWRRTADIDKDVNESSDGITSLLDTFKSVGIDPSQFDDPLLDTSTATAHPDDPTAPLPVSSNDTSFLDTFLNTFPVEPTIGDASASSFSDAILPPIDQPTDMDTGVPELESGLLNEAPKICRGRKRKSDVLPLKSESPNMGRPKRRKEK